MHAPHARVRVAFVTSTPRPFCSVFLALFAVYCHTTPTPNSSGHAMYHAAPLLHETRVTCLTGADSPVTGEATRHGFFPAGRLPMPSELPRPHNGRREIEWSARIMLALSRLACAPEDISPIEYVFTLSGAESAGKGADDVCDDYNARSVDTRRTHVDHHRMLHGVLACGT